MPRSTTNSGDPEGRRKLKKTVKILHNRTRNRNQGHEKTNKKKHNQHKIT